MAKHTKHVWEDCGEWGEYVTTAEASPEHRGERSSRTSDTDFAGASWDDAVTFTRDGWAEGAHRAEAIAGRIEESVRTMTRGTVFGTVWDVSGGTPDIGAFLDGEPECMMDTIPMPGLAHGTAVRLVVPVTCNCTIKSETIMARGAAVVALIDAMTAAGHPIEVWAADASRGQNQTRWSSAVKVQAADEPVDIGRIAWMLAHTASFRKCFFAEMEAETDAETFRDVDLDGGKGHAVAVEERDLPDDLDGQSVILPHLDRNGGWSEDEAVAWVIETLDTLLAPAE